MPKIIDLKQNTPEWKQWRRYKVGASDLPIIMGISPFKTELQLWQSKIFGEDSIPNEAMKRGSNLEPKALQWYLEKKKSVPFSPHVLQHEEIEWAIASMDGYWEGFQGGRYGIEVKAPGIEAHMIALSGRVPIYYIPQLQWQMFVADLQEITYLSFDGEAGVYFQVQRNQDYILKELLPSASRFYQSLIDFKQPEPSDRDTVEIFDPIRKEAANRYIALSAESKRIQEELSKLRDQLEPVDDVNRIRVNGLSITKVISKGGIDYKAIPELANVDLEKYRKEPVRSWRFTPPKESKIA